MNLKQVIVNMLGDGQKVTLSEMCFKIQVVVLILAMFMVLLFFTTVCIWIISAQSVPHSILYAIVGWTALVLSVHAYEKYKDVVLLEV